MSFQKYWERLRIIDHLIKKKRTGNPASLAQKLNISRSALFGLIKEMKELGFPVAWSEDYNSYFYEIDGGMVDKIFEAFMGKDEFEKLGNNEFEKPSENEI